jgi:beta-glucosidase
LTAAFQEEVARWSGMGALYGLFRADPWSAVTLETGIRAHQSARAANLLQHYIREHTRLAIPVLLTEECPHGHMALDGTLLPVGIAVAATWNPSLYERAMGYVGRELRSRGAHMGLVTNLDLARDPRWGRTEECYGEDPCLAFRCAEASVYGLQGRAEDDFRRGHRVAAGSKHFTAHGVPEGGRNAGPSSFGERELREIHLPAAEAVVRAGARSLMCCYNEIDGLPCHTNRKLLRGILRDDWGFNGFLMADGTALDRLVMQAGDLPGAAAMGLKAGVDLSLWDDAFTRLEEAFERGLVTMEEIDEAATNVLRVKFELGLFENPFTDEGAYLENVGNAQIKEASLQISRECLTLLRNEGDLLPLGASYRRIAVIGPNADQLYNQLGDYTAPQAPGSGVTVLQGLKEVAGTSVEIAYERGCSIRGTTREGFAKALQTAAASDVVVLVLGGSSTRNFDVNYDVNGAAIVGGNPSEMDCGEGMDVADLALGGVQEELAKAILDLDKPTVLILVAGRPHTMPELFERIPAILCAWYPGPFGGRAIAEAIFGHIEPTGRLPLTWPRSVGQLPVCYNRKEPNSVVRYVDLPQGPQFAFGHGLGYTKFEYRQLRIDKHEIAASDLRGGDKVAITADLVNIGSRVGTHVAQLYIKDIEASITRRVMELKGFEKCAIAPGQTHPVTFLIGFNELAIWCADMTFDVEPGRILLMIGSSSSDIRVSGEIRIV